MVNIDGAAKRSRQGIEADTLDAMDGDRVRFENTSNPLFARQALTSWIGLNWGHASAEVVPLPMPDWVAGYLRRVAGRILGLANGRDFDGTVGLTRKPAPAGSDDRQPRPGKPRITPGQAVKRLPTALGLIDKRWSAFRHLRELNSQEIDEMSVHRYKETGSRVAMDGRSRCCAKIRGATCAIFAAVSRKRARPEASRQFDSAWYLGVGGLTCCRAGRLFSRRVLAFHDRAHPPSHPNDLQPR